jgi:hypothetical protein
MKKLEQQELDTLQESMKKYNECKMQLGETVLRQQALMMQVTMIQKESEVRSRLSDRYENRGGKAF